MHVLAFLVLKGPFPFIYSKHRHIACRFHWLYLNSETASKVALNARYSGTSEAVNILPNEHTHRHIQITYVKLQQ